MMIDIAEFQSAVLVIAVLIKCIGSCCPLHVGPLTHLRAESRGEFHHMHSLSSWCGWSILVWTLNLLSRHLTMRLHAAIYLSVLIKPIGIKWIDGRYYKIWNYMFLIWISQKWHELVSVRISKLPMEQADLWELTLVA